MPSFDTADVSYLPQRSRRKRDGDGGHVGVQAAADGRRRFQRLIACDDAPAGGEVRLVEGEGKNDVAAGTKRGIKWKWVEKRAAAGGRGRLRKRRRYCRGDWPLPVALFLQLTCPFPHGLQRCYCV